MQTQSFYTRMDRHGETRVLRQREQNRKGSTPRDPADPVQPEPNVMSADENETDNDEKRATLETQLPAENSNSISALDVPREDGVRPTHVTWNQQTFPLVNDLIRVGRSPHNEIMIPVNGVSRFHAHIRRRDDTLYLEDLGSTNGTTLNGTPVESERPLSVGDVVYLSREKLVFHRQSD
jgi:hypothetical protein